MLENAPDSSKGKTVCDKELINKIIGCKDFEEYLELANEKRIPENCLTTAFLLELFRDNEAISIPLFNRFIKDSAIQSTLEHSKKENCTTAYSDIVSRIQKLNPGTNIASTILSQFQSNKP